MSENDKKPRSYTTVSIPNNLMARVDAVVENDKYGYQNRADFILESIRKRLRELNVLE